MPQYSQQSPARSRTSLRRADIAKTADPEIKSGYVDGRGRGRDVAGEALAAARGGHGEGRTATEAKAAGAATGVEGPGQGLRLGMGRECALGEESHPQDS